MAGNESLFDSYNPCTEIYTMRIADGSVSKVVGIGSIVLTKDLILKFVLLVPNLVCNLLLVNKLIKDMNCVTNFHSKYCEF